MITLPVLGKSLKHCTQASLAILMIFTTSVLLASSPEAQKAFDNGVTQYRSGDHAAALESFHQAKAAGLSTPSLHFNLGLTLYKLGLYSAARNEFEQLRAVPGYKAEAEFHLGLVAARSGDRSKALVHLRAAEAAADNDKLRALARSTIQKLDPASEATPGIAYVSVGVGFDSNPVLLADDTQNGQGDNGDGYAEVLGLISHPLHGLADDRIAIEATGYARQYGDVPDFDQQAGQLGLLFQVLDQQWKLAAMLSGEIAFVGGDHFQNLGSIGLDLRRRIDRNRIKLQYQASQIAGGSRYEYLDGTRHRANIELAHRLDWGRLRLSYDLEFNDRDDLTIGDEFFSRSPLRHRVGLNWNAPLSERWQWELGVRYRDTRYADPDRFVENSSPREERREEQLSDASAGLRYKFTDTWSVLTQYQYEDNRSNLDQFTYDRHSISVALEWTALDL